MMYFPIHEPRISVHNTVGSFISGLWFSAYNSYTYLDLFLSICFTFLSGYKWYRMLNFDFHILTASI